MRRADGLERLLHDTKLLTSRRVGDIEHYQQKLPVHGLLERGTERGDQMVRQISYEADRVADEHAGAGADKPLLDSRLDRVANSLLFAKAPSPSLTRLNSVDLPALVYPTSPTVK